MKALTTKRSNHFKDLTGKVYGRLAVVSFAGIVSGGMSSWLCRCECGTEKTVRISLLQSGRTKSCGCLQKQSRFTHTCTHGATAVHSEVRMEYGNWSTMKSRCYNPNSDRFHTHGARGIIVCERWKNSFQYFLDDMGKKPPHMTLERVNNDGNYEPSNCVWATSKQQANNKRTNHKLELNGAVMNVCQWAEKLGIKARTIHSRIMRKWTTERILSTPARAIHL